MNDLMTKSFTTYIDLKKSLQDLDLESGPDPENIEIQTIQPDHNLTLFLQEAETIKQDIYSIHETLTTLQLTNQESKSLHKTEELKQNRRRINNIIVMVLNTAKGVKKRLDEMDRANAENRRVSGCKMGTGVDRTRTAVANGLRKKMKEVMMEFQVMRQRMMSEYKETVGRMYFMVMGEEANEEVIEKIIGCGNDGHGGQEFLSKAIQEHGRGKVLETVVEIQDRHDAAKEIETSLLELHQVFLDMAVMVEAQGEKMDDIEHHVMNAAHYVNDGTKNLKTAKGYQKQSRKWMCIGIILLLIIILFIIIPVSTSVTKS